ncbi:LANO_0B04302g1_1 [Lachancea nothofagi CBS 11611]|uniref:LANO_0B04302g1_1 n=1 Tax=Lachancea nothofagi CBS 11611 TaxID=1266666 RepID=A0A1G4IY25_9SACH|nr:LANO_0B04302g1_1 [Lachancea nothofagi CBS 11611]
MDSVAGFFWDDGFPKKPKSSASETLEGNSKPLNHGERKSSVGSINGATNAGSTTQQYLADKLVEKLIYMALPPSSELARTTIEHRVESSRNRPGLSVPIMSRNFIQMNSRLGPPFLVIDEIIKILSWSNTAYTLSILSLFTYIVMKPLPTLTSIPVFYIVFGIMVPQYLRIHKPDSNTVFMSNPVPAGGPPLIQPEIPKPVPEFSKEFLLNLTDLQNHMLLYVAAFDFVNNILARFAFFTDESVSSAAFLVLLMLAWFNALFIDSLSSFIPVKPILILFGWASVLALHPNNRERVLDKIYSEETRLRVLMLSSKVEQKVHKYFEYHESSEMRQASIFEVQKFQEHGKTWELVGYSTDHYTLFSDYRISEKVLEDAAHHLDDVKAPVEWEWTKHSKWEQDLDPVLWVELEFVEYVDVDVETKWVYDICLDGSRGEFRRRRWIRECIRVAEDVKPEKHPLEASASQVEKAGNSSDTIATRSRKDYSDLTGAIPKSTSVGSVSSLTSKHSVSGPESPGGTSRAKKSLADFLNIP